MMKNQKGLASSTTPIIPIAIFVFVIGGVIISLAGKMFEDSFTNAAITSNETKTSTLTEEFNEIFRVIKNEMHNTARSIERLVISDKRDLSENFTNIQHKFDFQKFYSSSALVDFFIYHVDRTGKKKLVFGHANEMILAEFKLKLSDLESLYNSEPWLNTTTDKDLDYEELKIVSLPKKSASLPFLSTFIKINVINPGQDSNISKSTGYWLIRSDVYKGKMMLALKKAKSLDAFAVTAKGELLVHSSGLNSANFQLFESQPELYRKMIFSALELTTQNFTTAEQKNLIVSAGKNKMTKSVIFVRTIASEINTFLEIFYYRAILILIALFGLIIVMTLSFTSKLKVFIPTRRAPNHQTANTTVLHKHRKSSPLGREHNQHFKPEATNTNIRTNTRTNFRTNSGTNIRPKIGPQSIPSPPPMPDNTVSLYPRQNEELAQWYLLENPSSQPTGPFTLNNIRHMLQTQQLSFNDSFVYRSGDLQLTPVSRLQSADRRGTTQPPPVDIPPPPTNFQMSVEDDQWYLSGPNNQILGPFLNSVLEQKLISGEIERTSLIWKKGLAQWIRIYEAPGFDQRVGRDVA